MSPAAATAACERGDADPTTSTTSATKPTMRPANRDGMAGTSCRSRAFKDTTGRDVTSTGMFRRSVRASTPLLYCPVVETKTNVQRVLGYYAKYKRALVFGSASVIASYVPKAAGPTVIERTIDDLRQASVANGPMHHSLLVYGSILLAIVAVQGLFLYLQRWILICMSRDVEYDIRNEFFAHLEKLSQSFYMTNRTGDLMARATNDIGAVRMMIGPALMYAMGT